MHRRAFLKGLLASAAVLPSISPMQAIPVFTLRTTVAAGEIYGRSPAMTALPDFAWREAMWGEMLSANALFDDMPMVEQRELAD